MHCRCHKMVSSDGTGRSSVTQGVAGLTHEGEGCTVRSVEEFRASDEQGGCCQMPQRREGLVARKRGLKVATLVGRRGYVPLAFRWRCGSGMTLSHSTQRTMPASCSSSVTRMEIMRLCIQARGGFVGRDCRARPDCSRFMMHLQGIRVEWLPLSLRVYNQQSVARLHACGLKQPDAEP